MNLPSVILASKSPRRQELLKLMNIDFRVVLKEVDESYPEGLTPRETAVYISEKKAHAFDGSIDTGDIVLTADTIVCIGGSILGKPENENHAFEMLSALSGSRHDVITGVSMLVNNEIRSFYDITEVYFRYLSPGEIRYYITNFKPFDKAGSYGIQEWIGVTGIEKINGSYTNVMGLPTEKLYKKLVELGCIDGDSACFV